MLSVKIMCFDIYFFNVNMLIYFRTNVKHSDMLTYIVFVFVTT